MANPPAPTRADQFSKMLCSEGEELDTLWKNNSLDLYTVFDFLSDGEINP